MSYYHQRSNDGNQQESIADHSQCPKIKSLPKALRDALQHIANKQEKLAKSREDVIIKRQRLSSLRSQVRAKRIETGDAEAMLMSNLRTFMNDIQHQIPESLLESYNHVENLRNELGVIEEEFLQSEKTVAGSEWEFLDKENDFYQFELLDAIENALPEGTSQSHDREQTSTQTVSTLNLQIPRVHMPQFPPPPPPPPPPGYRPIALDGGKFHQPIPPPPPPPPLQHYLHPPMSPGSLTAESFGRQHTVCPPLVTVQPSQDLSAEHNPDTRDYDTVMNELETLRKQFETFRHERAKAPSAIDDDLVSIVDSPDVVIDHNRSAQLVEEQSYFETLQQISDHEVEARRLKNEVMFNDIQLLAIPRRFSDPTDFINAAPTPSIFMGRALTETALPMLPKDPRVKGRLREWLLAQLKEDALQRRIYRNISMFVGLETPADETWEERAGSYWNIDHASDCETESVATDDGDDGNTITRATSHEPSGIPCPQSTGVLLHSLSSFGNMRPKPEASSDLTQPRATPVPSPSGLARIRTSTMDKAQSDDEQPPQDLASSIGRHRLELKGNDFGFEVKGNMDMRQGTAKLQTMRSSTLALDVPTIVTTPADKDPELSEEQLCNDRSEMTRPQREVDCKTLDSVSCGHPWSEVLFLTITDPPRSMSENGDEKVPQGRRERLGRLLSNFRHHRRTRSAPFGHGANYNKDERRED